MSKIIVKSIQNGSDGKEYKVSIFQEILDKLQAIDGRLDVIEYKIRRLEDEYAKNK
jgi:hypothetical protein